MEGGTDHDLHVLESNDENTSNDEVVSESKDNNEAEAGEVPDASKSLHQTASIFFRHLPMQTTKDDLENVEIFSKNISNEYFYEI